MEMSLELVPQLIDRCAVFAKKSQGLSLRSGWCQGMEHVLHIDAQKCLLAGFLLLALTRPHPGLCSCMFTRV